LSSLASRSKRAAGDRKSGTSARQESPRSAFGLRRAGLAAAIAVALLVAAQFFYLVPDSAGHVAWVRSLIWDRDVDFSNEFARFGMIDR
jgi:hypothetical protein